MSTHKDIMVLIDFIESICDEDMKTAHNLAGPLSRLKPPVDGNHAWHRFLEIIGDCANCEKPIDRYSPYDECSVFEEVKYLCNNCSMSFTDEELAEKDIDREPT